MKPIAVATKFALYGTVGLGVAVGALTYMDHAKAAGGTDRVPIKMQRVTDEAKIEAAGFPSWSQYVYEAAPGRMTRLITPAEMTAEAKAFAEMDSTNDPAKSLFGSTDTSTYTVPGTAFQAVSSSTLISRGFSGDFGCPDTEGNDEYFAPVNLPSGALVTSIRAFGYDASASDDADFYLRQVCYVSGTNSFDSSTVASVNTPGAFAGGNFAISGSAVTHTVDNADCSYIIEADTSEGVCSSSPSVYFVEVKFKRQISPAPVSATFLDVPVGSTFHKEVEAMVDAGITGGCGGGNFCPNASVTRGQLAAFMARGLGLHWDEN